MKRSYFAGSNTTSGFVSYYDKIFGSCERIYIIKGGPGTGKSRLMKEIADASERNGDSVEYFYCSFDPASLDGIIINENVAMIDGTAPHVYEPTLPGVKENLIDLGAFWDSAKLREKKSEIEDLILSKKRCFNIAYSYLASVDSFDKACENILKKYIRWDKLNADAAKMISETKPSFKGEGKIRLVSSVGMRGRVHFDSFNNGSQRKINLCDKLGIGHLYLDAIKREAERFGTACTVSYHPLFAYRIDELLVGDSILFTLYQNEDDNIGIDIFEDIPKIELEHINALRLDMKKYEEKASEWFKNAAEFHFEIERLFVSAMDFDKKEEFTSELVKELMESHALDKK